MGVTSSSDSRPSLSRLGEGPPKDAPLSTRTRYALEWMEERRWSLLRTTDVGSVEHMAWHEMRYGALRSALLTLIESEELRPPEEED